MNVKFNQYSPDDLAKLINVDGASIRYLCRLGIIDARKNQLETELQDIKSTILEVLGV